MFLAEGTMRAGVTTWQMYGTNKTEDENHEKKNLAVVASFLLCELY